MPAAQSHRAGPAEGRAETTEDGPAPPTNGVAGGTAADVAGYYDRNTRTFLRLGSGRHQRVIHRGVWGPGVRTREEASHYVHQCLSREVQELAGPAPRLLDLGCGVGASLSYLLERQPNATGVGMTVSAVQVALATRQAHSRARFVRGDFCRDTLPSPVDLAYAIEAFVHATAAEAFFASVVRALRPAGRLVIVDDFLAGSGPPSALVREFQEGWHARSLLSTEATDAVAAAAGLRLREDRDLTPYLELSRPRDRVLAALATVWRPLAPVHPWFQSLAGGNALRACLAAGLVTYRWRVWEKAAAR